jgi:small subunit ribosomal protein S7e
LKDLLLDSVKEKEVILSKGKTKTVYLVYVPFVCLRALQSVQRKIIAEIEKKLKNTVLFLAKRTIQSKWVKPHKSQIRPRNRTLTAVHEAILDDLVLPGTIIGKRIRCRVDGSRFYKMYSI